MTSTTGIFCLLPLLLLVGPLSPYIRTVVSNSVPPADQARAFAAYSALEGMSSLAGPVYSAVYVLLVQRGAAWVIFELMAGAVVVALGIVAYVRLVPALAVLLPGLYFPGVDGGVDGCVDGSVGDVKSGDSGDSGGSSVGNVDAETQLLSPLLTTDHRDHHNPSGHHGAQRASRASRTSRASAEDTTLLFLHLAHTQEETESVSDRVL